MGVPKEQEKTELRFQNRTWIQKSLLKCNMYYPWQPKKDTFHVRWICRRFTKRIAPAQGLHRLKVYEGYPGHWGCLLESVSSIATFKSCFCSSSTKNKSLENIFWNVTVQFEQRVFAHARRTPKNSSIYLKNMFSDPLRRLFKLMWKLKCLASVKNS